DADGGQRGDRFDRGRGRAGARGAGQAAGRDPGAGGRAAGRVSMRWDVVAWAAVALLLFAAEALAPGAFMLWMGFAAAALFVTVLFVPGIPLLAQIGAFVVLSFVSIQVYRKWFRQRARQSDRPTLNRRAAQHIGRVVPLERA